MTLLVNIFGGPGVGKSTMAASLFAHLKADGHDCELVTEYAKDLIWDGVGHLAAQYPLSYFAEQHRRIHRLQGKVDVIICDSPLLLALVYQQWSPEFVHLVKAEHKRWPTLNLFIDRDTDTYSESGRLHSLKEAKGLDRKINKVFEDNCNGYRLSASRVDMAYEIVSNWVELSKK